MTDLTELANNITIRASELAIMTLDADDDDPRLSVFGSKLEAYCTEAIAAWNTRAVVDHPLTANSVDDSETLIHEQQTQPIAGEPSPEAGTYEPLFDEAISLGGCYNAELSERLGVWSKEVMVKAEVLKNLGKHPAAGNSEKLSEDLRKAATALAERGAEIKRLREALVMAVAEMMRASGRLEIIATCNEDRRLSAALSGTCDFARSALKGDA